MRIIASDLSAPQAYKLLTGIVVPRPIAWITSVSNVRTTNLAPFSCFTFVSSNPPMVGVNIGPKESGQKDTAANIAQRGVYIVNIADDSMIGAVHSSSFEHPADVSEAELLGLATLPGEMVDCPRLRDVPVSMECRLSETARFGRGGTAFIVGEIVCFHIRDDLHENGKIATARLRPICRIAGPNYATLGPIVTQSALGSWGPPGTLRGPND